MREKDWLQVALEAHAYDPAAEVTGQRRAAVALASARIRRGARELGASIPSRWGWCVWLVAGIAIDRAISSLCHGGLRRCRVVAAVLWDHASGRFVRRSDGWPYGPADHHEPCCTLFDGAPYCDCKASDAGDAAWGRQA